MTRYNKLVRDRIPEIILKKGQEPKTKQLSLTEFRRALLRKIIEEAREIRAAGRSKEEMVKEIGDAQETLEAIIEAFDLDAKEIRETKRQRKKERGGFEKRVFLISVK